ncbi:MAG: hypothetical protein ACOZCO_04630 [Bacteroidota bacterium]
MRNLLLAGLVLAMIPANAQDKKKAASLFEAGDFEAAMEEYQLLLDKEPENSMYSYRLGICYLNTNLDKTRAIPYLEKAVAAADADPNSLYLLGRAYHFSYKFDKAIECFNKFQKGGKGTPENLQDAAKQIEYCQNALELMKFPVNVKFENLGSGVNSKYPDYYPFVPLDESFLLFTSRRNDGSNARPNGSFYSNVYISKTVKGKFEIAKPVSALNTKEEDEAIVGLSNSGQVAILYTENLEGAGDLFSVQKSADGFSGKVLLDKEINTKYEEIAASISADSNEIYFASNMPDGFGGIDIYVSRKLPNGKWSTAQNLGPSVNTPMDEDFPSISPDGKTLFFSSKGHAGMGGYDIFKAEFDNEKMRFMQVRNVGFPINTPEDDMNLRMDESGKYGYISALRSEGLGDLDIYRVNFLDNEPRYTLYTGTIKTTDAAKPIDGISILISDAELGELYGEYLPNPNSMRYVIILPPGKFRLDVEAEGFKSHMEVIEVLDKNEYRFEIKKDIQLEPEK